MALRGRKIQTATVRLDAETVRLVKVASARSRESMQAWLDRACRMRLEGEKTSAGDRKRVASVTWQETWDDGERGR